MMQSDGLSAKYAKTVQLLQKKKDELEQVFDEARALEADNGALMAQNRELRSRNLELESATKSMSFEFAALETQVKKQQSKLQHYIDLEASGHGTSKARPQDAAKIAQLTQESTEWRRKFHQQEETMRASDEAKGRLQANLDTATEELKDLREKLASTTAAAKSATDKLTKLEGRERDLSKQLEDVMREKVDFAHDSSVLDRIEADALVGLRQEIVLLTEENHRLMDQLEDERTHMKALRSESERFDELIRKQRYLADGQLKIARDEVVALNTQNESLLSEMKRLTVEREQLKKRIAADTPHREAASSGAHNAAKKKTVTVELPPTVAPPSPPPVDVRSRGTMTVEVYEPPTNASQSVEAVSPIPHTTLPPAATPAPAPDASLAALERMQAALDHLEVTNEALVAENDGLRGLLHEKSASIELQEEKNRLLQTDVQRLRVTAQQLHATAAATPLERLLRSPSQGHDTSNTNRLLSNVDDINRAVGSVLLLGTKAYHATEAYEQTLLDVVDTASSCSDTDDAYAPSVQSQSHVSGAAVAVPIVPCDKYQDNVVNRVMEQLGGLRYVLKRVLRSLKSQLRRAEFNPQRGYGKPRAPMTDRAGAPDERIYQGSSADGQPRQQHASANWGTTPPTGSGSAARSTVFDLDAWLAVRRGHASPDGDRSIGRTPGASSTRRPTSRYQDAPDLSRDASQGTASGYTSGTTLLEVVEELRKTPVSRYRR